MRSMVEGADAAATAAILQPSANGSAGGGHRSPNGKGRDSLAALISVAAPWPHLSDDDDFLSDHRTLVKEKIPVKPIFFGCPSARFASPRMQRHPAKRHWLHMQRRSAMTSEDALALLDALRLDRGEPPPLASPGFT